MFGIVNQSVNLLRPNVYATVDVVPGTVKFFENKGTDFGTTIGNVTNTQVSGIVDTENIDGTGYWAIYACNETGSALTAGKFYELFHLGTMDSDPSVRLFVDGTTSVGRLAVCAVAATADEKWGWFAFQGVFPNASVGDTVDNAIVAGNMLKITTNNDQCSVSSLILDSTGADFSLNTIAVSLGTVAVAEAPSVGNSVYLFGRQAYVNQT